MNTGKWGVGSEIWFRSLSAVKDFFVKFGSRFCAKHGNLKSLGVTVHYCVSWKRKSRVNVSGEKEREEGGKRERNTVSLGRIRRMQRSSFGPISGKKSKQSKFRNCNRGRAIFEPAAPILRAVTRDTHRTFYVSTVSDYLFLALLRVLLIQIAIRTCRRLDTNNKRRLRYRLQNFLQIQTVYKKT